VRQIERFSRYYDCYAAERGGAAVRQAPSPQVFRIRVQMTI